MELCDTCKPIECRKNIVTKKRGNLTTIKCLDYKKDIEKVKGYKKPLHVTAKRDGVIEVEM